MSLVNRHPGAQKTWAEKYARCCRKRLDDNPLSDADRELEAIVELLGERLPGVVEDELLGRSLEGDWATKQVAAAEAGPATAVEDLPSWGARDWSRRWAASTGEPPKSCYDW